jgi:hypothetical protein
MWNMWTVFSKTTNTSRESPSITKNNRWSTVWNHSSLASEGPTYARTVGKSSGQLGVAPALASCPAHCFELLM